MPAKGFTKIAKFSKLGEGEMLVAEVNKVRMLVCKVDGEVYAVSEECPHAAGPMSEGTLTEFMIECPWHASVFDVRTGEFKEGPATSGLTAYEVEIDGDDIYVGPEVL